MFATGQFEFKNGVFSQNASFFEDRFLELFHIEFENKGNQGFELVSSKSGKTVNVLLDKVVMDKNDNITAWEFTPENDDSFIKVVIYNDN